MYRMQSIGQFDSAQCDLNRIHVYRREIKRRDVATVVNYNDTNISHMHLVVGLLKAILEGIGSVHIESFELEAIPVYTR